MGDTSVYCFPIWPDAEESADEVFPAPDGRAWTKCCGECAFRKNDPQQLGDNYQRELLAGAPGSLFYCVHRTDDAANNRVCAAYGAVHRHDPEVAHD